MHLYVIHTPTLYPDLKENLMFVCITHTPTLMVLVSIYPSVLP